MNTLLSIVNLFLDMSGHRADTDHSNAHDYLIVIYCLVGLGLFAFFFAPAIFSKDTDKEFRIWGCLSIVGVIACVILLIHMCSH